VIRCLQFLEIELELVFVRDGDSEALSGDFIVVEAHSKGREVNLAVPLFVVCHA
jgi:hypothetical protein